MLLCFFQLFTERQFKRLMKDAPLYKKKIWRVSSCFGVTFLGAHKEMYSARKRRLETSRVLAGLIEQAKKAYEDDQAGKAGSDCEIGRDRKKICLRFDPVMIERQVCFVFHMNTLSPLVSCSKLVLLYLIIFLELVQCCSNII